VRVLEVQLRLELLVEYGLPCLSAVDAPRRCNTSMGSGHVGVVSTRERRFEGVYAAHAGRVGAYVRRRAASSVADDVVADTFLVAWRRLDDVPDPALPWLLGVARRLLANQRRRDGRAAALRERLVHCTPAPGAVDELSEPDSRAWLALRELSDADREVLTLSAWEGLSAAEIAVVLDVRPNTVSVRLHRARRRFAAALAELDGTTTDGLEVRR
jgi:RNA polymerase sigma-70 factor (ECF subfamily)